jgi:hypothetical protein
MFAVAARTVNEIARQSVKLPTNSSPIDGSEMLPSGAASA